MQNHYRKNRGKILQALMVIVLALIFALVFIPTKYVVLVIGLVGTSALFTWRSEFGVYAMSLFLPLTYLMVHFHGSVISVVDLIGLIAFFGFSLRTAFCFVFYDMRVKLPFFKYFALFFVVVLASALYSKYPLVSLKFAVRIILFFYLVYFLYPINVLSDKTKIKKALSLFVLSAVFCAIVSVVAVTRENYETKPFRFKLATEADQSALIALTDDLSGGIVSLDPYLTEHVLLAETLLPAIFFALALLSTLHEHRRKKLARLLIVFILMSAVLTFSRGAWIGLVVASGFYLWINGRLRKNTLLILLVISLSLPVLLYMYKLQTTYEIGGSSTQNRLLSMLTGAEIWSRDTYLGIGPGQFVDYLNENIFYRARFGAALDAFGWWQKILTENGMFGFAAFLAFVVGIARYLHKVLLNCYNQKFVSAVYAGALSIVVFELFNTSYYQGRMWLPIALAVAVAHVVEAEKTNVELYARK